MPVPWKTLVLLVSVVVVVAAVVLYVIPALTNNPTSSCPPTICSPGTPTKNFIIAAGLVATAPCFAQTVFTPSIGFTPGGPGGPQPPGGSIISGSYTATITLAVTYPNGKTYLWNAANAPTTLATQTFNVGACNILTGAPGFGQAQWTFYGTGPVGPYSISGSGQITLNGGSSTSWNFYASGNL